MVTTRLFCSSKYHNHICYRNFFYRKKYNDDKNKVVFLAVSDDNEWLKVINIKKCIYIYLVFLSTNSFIATLEITNIMQENLGNNSDVMFGSDYSSLSVPSPDHIGYKKASLLFLRNDRICRI